MGVVSKAARTVTEGSRRCAAWVSARVYQLMKSTSGQGTTEYAILVGVLVVIAIIAIVAFRENLQNLWNAIMVNVNSLDVPK